MFKSLKKYSKLLLLGLAFSVALPFSSSATDPQDTSNLNIAQIKREREEKISRVLSDEYNINSMIPNFVAEGDDKKQWPKCEMPAIYRLSDDKLLGSSHPTAAPCNHRVKNFFLVPDHNQTMHIIGSDCIRRFFISEQLDLDKNLPKKLKICNPLEAQKHDHQKQTFIATEILKYFFDQRNWNNKKCHGNVNGKDVAPANSSKNFVLDLNGLKDELGKEGHTFLTPINSCLVLWRYRDHISGFDKYRFRIYYESHPSSLKASSSSFDSDIPLSDDKIFEAFKFFCELHGIYQPFTLER